MATTNSTIPKDLAVADYNRDSYERVLRLPKVKARHLLFLWTGNRNLAWRIEKSYLTFTGNAEADAQRALNAYWADHQHEIESNNA